MGDSVVLGDSPTRRSTIWYISLHLGTQSTGETTGWIRERRCLEKGEECNDRKKRADADRRRGNKSAERRLGVGLAQEVEGVL